MTLTISMQGILVGICYAICLGGFFAFVYDAVRLIRLLLGTVYQGRFLCGVFSRHAKVYQEKIRKHRQTAPFRYIVSIVDFLLDFLYLLFCGVCFSIFLYWINHGIFRFFFLFGVLVGFSLYRKTVGRLTFFVLREISSFLMICFAWLFRLLKKIWIHLFLRIWRKILLLFHKIYGIINNDKRKKKNSSSV